jgi:5-formyltetrahydrofolate cyclo-ligase
MRQPTTESIVECKDIELMIIPMIGFNKSNNRMGYGFNHYNNYLQVAKNIYTIGLAYDFQRNDDFITTSYDKMLDKIVTN